MVLCGFFPQMQFQGKMRMKIDANEHNSSSVELIVMENFCMEILIFQVIIMWTN